VSSLSKIVRFHGIAVCSFTILWNSICRDVLVKSLVLCFGKILNNVVVVVSQRFFMNVDGCLEITSTGRRRYFRKGKSS
jgi:hypothetical protein